jgi:hypothetical protein
VGENDSNTWASRMTVPPLPSSALPQCSIIDVDYRLEVSSMGLLTIKGQFTLRKFTGSSQLKSLYSHSIRNISAPVEMACSGK